MRDGKWLLNYLVEEEIQEIAEDKLGRKLNQEELIRLKDHLEVNTNIRVDIEDKMKTLVENKLIGLFLEK